MIWQTKPEVGDDNVEHTPSFQKVKRLSTRRRDVLGGLVLVGVVVLGVVVGGAASDDVFASSSDVRRLADSECALVSALRRYVADEQRRLQHIVRYRPTCGSTA